MTREELKRWGRAFLVSLVVFAFFSLYLYFRRGYYNLYIINKVFGSTAAVMAAITLLVGPLSKRLTFLSNLVTIRRELGIWAVGFAIVHIIFSLLQQNRFPFPDWYTAEWIPVSAGVIAVSAWLYMTYLSRSKKIKEMGVDVWKKRLSLFGWIAFGAVFIHLTVMKYPGWIRWWQGQVKASPQLANPEFPPASLFVFAIILIVIVYRLINEIIYKRNSK